MSPSSSLFQDLIADLKYELTGKFERLIVGLMRPLEYFDAKEIKDALKVKVELYLINASGAHGGAYPFQE